MSAMSSAALSSPMPMPIVSAAEQGLMSSVRSTKGNALNGSAMLKGIGSSAQGSSAADKAAEAARVAEDFEGVFASLLLKEMRKTLEPGTMFGEDSGDVYGGLFDQFMGQQMSQSGGFGMAKMVRESIARSQASINVAG